MKKYSSRGICVAAPEQAGARGLRCDRADAISIRAKTMPANGGALNAEIKDFLQRVAAKKLPHEEIFIFFAAADV